MSVEATQDKNINRGKSDSPTMSVSILKIALHNCTDTATLETQMPLHITMDIKDGDIGMLKQQNRKRKATTDHIDVFISKGDSVTNVQG